MPTRRAHVVLPEDLVSQIDRIVGTRGRSAFLAELARREIKRRHLLEVFQREEPIWKDQDHPELKGGSAKWVRKMRGESEARFRGIEKQRDRK
ncbi:MAG TPA: hypothetical protein VGV35_08690 [Bryobacteraceae bacterium]|nr:hypothetical protein [Bryobacteraceae bacterium]